MNTGDEFKELVRHLDKRHPGSTVEWSLFDIDSPFVEGMYIRTRQGRDYYSCGHFRLTDADGKEVRTWIVFQEKYLLTDKNLENGK